MKKLQTNYLGLELSSPLIMSSSGLSKTLSNIKSAEENGIGAVVLKSLFEEQIIFESNKAISQSIDYPEAQDYIKNYSRHNSVNEYLELIKQAKRTVKIPIIASINCATDVEWEDFTKDIEKAGADALELNINVSPFDTLLSSAQVEEKYFNIISQVKQNTKLKFAIKIGNNFTNLPHFIQQMSFRGVNTFVLFNKFYEPIIDINKLELTHSAAMSSENDIKHSLRWVAIIKGLLPDVEISASTGIHSANTAIQQLLAGATSVQICSVLYKKGIKEIQTINNEIKDWMDKNTYNSVNDFRGKLSYANIKDKQSYERFQFIKHFTSIE
ncbi:MAG: dihydroorotate dehydrogenase-like protein [Bacteroidales bacterium]|nr:dihydroorotate dehydrogenase-like protein [Bacteroidales bacterium]MDD3860578.1 dihydroorotate dehydrogenase-like protein [Bacteroidales bacterium]